MRKWKLALALAAVAAVTVPASLVATTAGAATTMPTPTSSFGPGQCGLLASNPDAAKAMLALRADSIKDMQTWWEKYGSDPTSATAQKALQALRVQHLSERQQLLKKYGITAPTKAPGGGCGRGMMGGGQGRMMGAGFSS